MLQIPFFSEIERAHTVLLAGMGGGFDVFSGLPLYFALRAAGKEVHLANLSFSSLPPVREAQLTPSLLQVTATTPLLRDYFPERYLSEWFRQTRQEEVPIYCFMRTGVRPLLANYQLLVERLEPDTVILVDGGMDSLMRGDEAGLGSPQEDIASLVAVNQLTLERKLLISVGFGVEVDVCHAHFLEAVADLIHTGGYLGMFCITQDMPEVRLYRQATEAVSSRMPRNVSIVSSSIFAALAGQYGDYQATARTARSKLWINPLMPVYWCFRLEAVAQRLLYGEMLQATETYEEVTGAIERFRDAYPAIKRWEGIPV